MSDRVSVLIRSSARPELADALSALNAQTHRNLEVVIVNVTGRPHPPLPGAAAPLTVNLVEPGRQLPRPQAANAALDAATGDHAMFLDDDDLIEPDHIAQCLAAVRSRPETIPFTGSQICDDEHALQAVWPDLTPGKVPNLDGDGMLALPTESNQSNRPAQSTPDATMSSLQPVGAVPKLATISTPAAAPALSATKASSKAAAAKPTKKPSK